jgi:hypothetical protein
MTSLSSPQVVSTGPCVYDLDRLHADRTSVYAALQAENRRLDKDCKGNRKRQIEGYHNTSRNMVLFCTDPDCPMMICVSISKSDNSATITDDSNLHHCMGCTSHAPSPTRQEMMAHDAFVEAAKVVESGQNQHKQINKLVAHYFDSSITAQHCSRLMKNIRERSALSGFAEGFSGLRHLLENFAKENPGTVYEIGVDENNKFLYVIRISGQSLVLVRESGRWYFGLDASHTKKQGYTGKVFVLEITDGNNCDVPIGIAWFDGEKEFNYSIFMRKIMSVGDGEMGRLLNREGVVVCTDRALAFSPTIEKCLPRANHRYCLHHILKNMHNNGWKDVDKHMMACHKATTLDEFNALMGTWRKAHNQSATYANEIHHWLWTTYMAIAPNEHNNYVPYSLHDLTGSQLVEHEMGRLKLMRVRHELPLTGMNNFINFYAALMSKQKSMCDTMVAGGGTYTQWASMACADNFAASKHYVAIHVGGGKSVRWEVTRRGEEIKHCKVDWAAKWCSCEKNLQRRLPCHHLCAVLKAKYAKTLLSAALFQQTFAQVIAPYYVAKTYVLGYEYQVGKPILTYLVYDNTKPPARATANTHQPGRTQLKRLLGPAERGWASLAAGKNKKRKGDNPLKKTAANGAAKNFDDAIHKESLEPELTSRAAARLVEEEKELAEQKRIEEKAREEALEELQQEQSLVESIFGLFSFS